MAKYTVTFSCGHEATIELFGKDADRKRKIAYLEESGICPECYAAAREAEKAEGCKEVEMSYSEYKNNYAECDTKKDSYDKKTKTIIVYVPIEPTEEEIVAKAEELVSKYQADPKSMTPEDIKFTKKYADTVKAAMKRRGLM